MRFSFGQLLLICVLMVRGVCSATAQTGGPPLENSSGTIRISTNLVLVNVVALRWSTSAPGATLTRDDFELFDNDRRVPIRTFDTGSATRPLAVWFLVQCSMSGWGDQGSGLFWGSIGEFRSVLKRNNGSDTYGLAHWCDDGTSDLDVFPSRDSDPALQKLEQVLSVPVAVRSHDRTGELALQAALQKIVRATQSQVPERIPAVIFLYDDYSAMPKGEADQFVDQLLRSSIAVYGLRHRRSPRIMDMEWLGGEKGAIADYIATQTGGSYLSVRPAQYADGLEQILDELHKRYELGFVPRDLDGRRHKLRVTLSSDARSRCRSTRLAYRSGYIAKRNPIC